MEQDFHMSSTSHAQLCATTPTYVNGGQRSCKTFPESKYEYNKNKRGRTVRPSAAGEIGETRAANLLTRAEAHGCQPQHNK